MANSSDGDQNFDPLADKFQHNIYGTTKGRLRHELLWHYLQSVVPLSSAARVLDAGGGTGVMSLALLQQGCQVTLNDVSADSLAMAANMVKQLPDAQQQQFSQQHGSIQDIPLTEQFDVIVCHAVLEWLQSPEACIRHLLSLLKPGGYLSLSFFNRDAHLFGNVLYGNFDYVNAGMKVKNRVRLNPQNPQSPQQILSVLEQAGVAINHRAGIRCFHDYLKQREMQQSHYEQLKDLELRYGTEHPYLWLGKYFHIIGRKQYVAAS